MDLMVAITLAFLGPPLAGVLFFIAAWKMRALRPKRAKAVMWSLGTIVVSAVTLMVLSSTVPGNPAAFEMVAMVVFVALGALATIATVALLVPKPESGAVVGLIVTGFICLILGGLVMVDIANTNFGL